MRRDDLTEKYTSHDTIRLRDLKNIDDYLCQHEPSLYYVKNGYSADSYYGRSICLYRYKIIKQTEFYYFLENGKRLHKLLRGGTYADTPDKALKKALIRAKRYLDILIIRGKDVSNFLKALDHRRKPGMKELRDFEAIAKTMDVEDIDPIAYRSDLKTYDEITF